MKKKLVVLMLSAAMTATLLTGCGDTKETTSESTTTETEAEATEEAADDSASDQEAALKSELEKLADNARYSDTYRHLQQIEKLKEEADITEYNDALTGLLDDWKKQYIKYKS